MKRALRVLLVEDNDDDAALLVREVGRAGYEPEARRVDTRAALEEALDEPWDVVLCDYRLPALDAPAAIAVVRSRQVDTPCIIVSGSVGEENAIAAMRSGAQDFVLKSNLSRLVPAIERELRDSEVRIKHALAESALRATEASFRSAFELIPDGVLVHRKGTVTHSNSSAASLLGAYRPEDLAGFPWLDLFAPSDREAARERMQVDPAGAGVPLAELTMVRLDGGLVHVETTATSVLFDGQPAVLNVVRDVSARRELVARSMQVDRMIAVGTLAAGVGHEINNPLAYVMANVAYAKGEVDRAQRALAAMGDREPATAPLATAMSEVVEILGEVSEGACRIRDIARDLNMFARNDEDLSLVDLRAAADAALRMATPEIRRRARVARQYDDVPSVRASASRIGQVLLNLVVNAAQAINTGRPDANEVGVRIRADGPNVVVEVSDTGSGIAPEHRARLFTPFFTTKPVGQGTGLGLSISKRIVQSLGGDIDVESVLGVGTTMRVTLPAAREQKPRSVPSLPAPAGRARLLFVDDERLLGVAFQRALAREHDVVVVETAAEVLSRLIAGEKFDVIFCDVHMPVMSGVELYEAVERTRPEVAQRFVMVTGGGYGVHAREFLESRKTPQLEKPLDMGQVRALLGRMLATSPGSAGAVV